LVSAQRGLGCIPIKTPKRKKPTHNAINLTILETRFRLRAIKAIIKVRRKKKYLGTSINGIFSLPVHKRKIRTTSVALSTLRISDLFCINNKSLQLAVGS